MARIKIISNPYEQNISYQKWDATSSGWIGINYENNRNSKLLSAELTQSSMPFVIRKILDEIIAEYQDGSGQIEIYFEGTAYESDILKSVCAEFYSEHITVAKTNSIFKDPAEICSDISQLFGDIKLAFSQNDLTEIYNRHFSTIQPDNFVKNPEGICSEITNLFNKMNLAFSQEKISETSEKLCNIIGYNQFLRCLGEGTDSLQKEIKQFKSNQQKHIDEIQQLRIKAKEDIKNINPGKAELIQRLETKVAELQSDLSNKYLSHMENIKKDSTDKTSGKELVSKAKTLIKEQDSSKACFEKAEEAVNTFNGNFMKNIGKCIIWPSPKNWKTMHDSFVSDIKCARNLYDAGIEAKSEDCKTATIKLHQLFLDTFSAGLGEAYSEFYQTSLAFWQGNADVNCRTLFMDNIKNSAELTENEKKNAIKSISCEKRFMPENRQEKAVASETDSYKKFLNDNENAVPEKLSESYFLKLKTAETTILNNIKKEHETSFRQWETDFFNKITDTILDTTPELKNQFEIVSNDRAAIADLEKGKSILLQWTEKFKRAINV